MRACGPLGSGLGTNCGAKGGSSCKDLAAGAGGVRGLSRRGGPGSSRATAGRACGLFRGDAGSRPAPQLTESESVLRCWKDSAPSTKPESTADVLSPSMLGPPQRRSPGRTPGPIPLGGRTAAEQGRARGGAGRGAGPCRTRGRGRARSGTGRRAGPCRAKGGSVWGRGPRGALAGALSAGKRAGEARAPSVGEGAARRLWLLGPASLSSPSFGLASFPVFPEASRCWASLRRVIDVFWWPAAPEEPVA